jgi:hypothetical protein
MAERAAHAPSKFVGAWVRLIRGIMRFRAGRRDAAADFTGAIDQAKEDLKSFENFDPLDTIAFSHAGLALLGRPSHADLAVHAYQRARELAPAAGIVDIGLTAFSCFGHDPAVAEIGVRLFGPTYPMSARRRGARRVAHTSGSDGRQPAARARRRSGSDP